MSFLKKHRFSLTLFFMVLLIGTVVGLLSIPDAKPFLKTTSKLSSKIKAKELVRFTAIGDSLTEGIGDSTESGGYVPLLKNDLMDNLKIPVVDSSNHGKAGDTVSDLIKRITQSKEIQEDIQNADFITLTIGGNDLMKVIKSELLSGLTYETFKTPSEEYQEELAELYSLIRDYNKKAPIYQLGIYNPFYLSLDNMEELQEIVDFWNKASLDAVSKQKKAYFISINEELYKGVDGKKAFGESEHFETASSDKSSGINNLISDTDNFHPNSLGYQIIANAFNDKLAETKKEWLESK